MSTSFEWQFGGWLRLLPPVVAWSLLGLGAVALCVLVIWSYRHTLRELRPAARVLLIALRLLLLLAVLICLANPERVEHRKTTTSVHDTLAVVVDRSESMTTPDYHHMTRLMAATQLWKQYEKEAQTAFKKIAFYRFSTSFQPVGSFDAAVKEQESGIEETHLYAALREALAKEPLAIVSLTDGLDTTEEESGKLVAKAQGLGVPIYFAVGKNRIHTGEHLTIREIKAPASVLRQTQFITSMLLEVDAAEAGDIPVALWSGATKLAESSLPVQRGKNIVEWPVTVTALEPGTMPLEFRLGSGETEQKSACAVQVVAQVKVEVLYYQGALQWGYHYLLDALHGDPSFHVESILNPSLGVHAAKIGEDSVMSDLPERAEELKRFQIVILAHPFADQLNPAQQQALLDYAREGGGVLFIAPDSRTTQAFIGTPLEQMLPVVFRAWQPEDTTHTSEETFHNQMLNAGGAFGDDPLNGGQRQEIPPLQPFELVPGAEHSVTAAIFRNTDAESFPKFAQYATVRRVKPGAEVLAIKHPNPEEKSETPLLARQKYGEGYTAFLATDLLWRWKMSLPSSSHAVEKFWQQLVFSLAPSSHHGLRLIKLTASPSVKTAVALRLEGGETHQPPVVESVSPSGGHKLLTLQHGESESDVWNASFIPDSTGTWQVRANDGEASLQFSVAAKSRANDELDVAPDIDGLRRIAEATGGALLDGSPAFQEISNVQMQERKQFQPLWHSQGMLVVLLGLFGLELLVRRLCRLL